MAILRAALVLKVRRNLQNRSDLAEVISDALTAAADEISSLYWKILLTRDSTKETTSGTQYITLPSDVQELLLVQLEDGTSSYTVTYTSKGAAEAKYPIADKMADGTPEVCYREATKLYFCPTPDDSLTVRLSYRASLDADSVDESFVSLMVAYASAMSFESLEHGTESADRWWRIYRGILRRKLRSQEKTGERHKVDTRMAGEEGIPDPRLRAPTAVWWRER